MTTTGSTPEEGATPREAAVASDDAKIKNNDASGASDGDDRGGENESMSRSSDSGVRDETTREQLRPRQEKKLPQSQKLSEAGQKNDPSNDTSSKHIPNSSHDLRTPATDDTNDDPPQTEPQQQRPPQTQQKKQEERRTTRRNRAPPVRFVARPSKQGLGVEEGDAPFLAGMRGMKVGSMVALGGKPRDRDGKSGKTTAVDGDVGNGSKGVDGTRAGVGISEIGVSKPLVVEGGSNGKKAIASNSGSNGNKHSKKARTHGAKEKEMSGGNLNGASGADGSQYGKSKNKGTLNNDSNMRQKSQASKPEQQSSRLGRRIEEKSAKIKTKAASTNDVNSDTEANKKVTMKGTKSKTTAVASKSTSQPKSTSNKSTTTKKKSKPSAATAGTKAVAKSSSKPQTTAKSSSKQSDPNAGDSSLRKRKRNSRSSLPKHQQEHLKRQQSKESAHSTQSHHSNSSFFDKLDSFPLSFEEEGGMDGADGVISEVGTDDLVDMNATTLDLSVNVNFDHGKVRVDLLFHFGRVVLILIVCNAA